MGEHTFCRSLYISGSFVRASVSSNYLYTVNRWGLFVFDIGTDDALRLVATLPTPDEAFGVLAAPPLLFIADRDAGVHIVDVRNPKIPQLLTTFDTPGGANDLARLGNRLLVADSENGMLVLDVSDPENPKLTAHFPLPEEGEGSRAVGIDSQNDLAALAVQQAGVYLLDVRRPDSPTPVGRLDTPGWAHEVLLLDTLMLVADRQNGLVVADISRLASPTILSQFQPNADRAIGESLTFGVAAAPPLALITDTRTVHLENEPAPLSLTLIDFSNPRAPVETGGVALGAEAVAVAVDSLRHAFVALADSGMARVDFRNAAAPQEQARFRPEGPVLDLTAREDRALISLGAAGAALFDLNRTREIARIPAPDGIPIAHGAFFDQQAVLSAGLRLLFYDLTDESSPILTQQLDLPLSTQESIQITEIFPMQGSLWIGYIRTALGTGGILAVRKPDGKPFEIAAHHPLEFPVLALMAEQATLAVAGGFSGAHIFRLQPDFSLQETASLPSSDFTADVEIEHSVLWLADGFTGVRGYRLSAQGSPEPVADIPTSGESHGVAAWGTVLAVANFSGPEALSMYDVSDPLRPQLLEAKPTPGFAQDVVIVPGFLLVQDGYDVTLFIQVIDDVKPPSHPDSKNSIRLQVFVPKNSDPVSIQFHLARAGYASIAIFDLLGRRLRTLSSRRWFAAGRHTLQWDRRGGNGQLLGNGVYFCRLWTKEMSMTQKMVLFF